MNYVQIALGEAERLRTSRMGLRSYLMKRVERYFRRLKFELEAFDGLGLLSGNFLITDSRGALLSPSICLLERSADLGDQHTLVEVFVEISDGVIKCRAECLWDGATLTFDSPEDLLQALAISLGSVLLPIN